MKFTEAGEILLEVWAEEERQEAAAAAADTAGADAAGAPADAAGAPADAGLSGAPSGGRGEGRGEARVLVLHFGVRDTGIGIGAESIGRLFQSFSQVGAGGRCGGSGGWWGTVVGAGNAGCAAAQHPPQGAWISSRATSSALA